MRQQNKESETIRKSHHHHHCIVSMTVLGDWLIAWRSDLIMALGH